MTNKAPFCVFLWLTITILSRLKTSMPSVTNKQFVKIRVNSWLNFLCALVPLWLKKPRNLRNPQLIKDLRLRKITYEKIKLFLQNKAKFQKSQMNVTFFITREYEQMDTWSSGKNKANSKPNKPKTNPILANKTPIRTQFKPKTNPISESKRPITKARSALFGLHIVVRIGIPHGLAGDLSRRVRRP